MKGGNSLKFRIQNTNGRNKWNVRNWRRVQMAQYNALAYWAWPRKIFWNILIVKLMHKFYLFI